MSTACGKTGKPSKHYVSELKPVTFIAILGEIHLGTGEDRKSPSSRVPFLHAPSGLGRSRRYSVDDLWKDESSTGQEVYRESNGGKLRRHWLMDGIQPWAWATVEIRGNWSHVIDKDVTDIGVEQSFLRLGGDSILATGSRRSLQGRGPCSYR